MSEVVKLERHDAVAVITVNSPPVNALSAAVRGGMLDCMKSAIADPDVKAIVLTCGGRTFIAGADITEFGKPPKPPGLQEVLTLMENSPKPIVAAIHGTALGGGLEVALACHYRVATKDARLGLPEVKLGLLPGAGGTQRLPRVVGAEPALEMIVSGDPISAQDALQTRPDRRDRRRRPACRPRSAFAEGAVAEKRAVAQAARRRLKLAAVKADRRSSPMRVAAMTQAARAGCKRRSLRRCGRAPRSTCRSRRALKKEREAASRSSSPATSPRRSATSSSPSARPPRSPDVPAAPSRAMSSASPSSAPAPWAAASRCLRQCRHPGDADRDRARRRSTAASA